MDTGVQVVNVTRNHTFELQEEALTRILLAEDVRDLPVMVVSVAGVYRSGKSFLLDFFLRYLNATPAQRRNGDWLGSDDEELVGFPWRTGSERHTIGIHAWSRLFPLTLPSGQKVAVMLMDTQGTFDNESTQRDCVTVFSLSMLLSSVQIYNISSNLKEDDLQNLQLFTEYAKLVASESGTPFQHLKFLIRDWMFTSTHEFGARGGQSLLREKLEIREDQAPELREIRQHIRSCFNDISCFLMAHPGFNVSDVQFRGRLADLRQEFKTCVRELVPLVFSNNNLVIKRISGEQITAQQLLVYFRTYIEMLQSDDIPTPVNILQATAAATLFLAVEAARAKYDELMEEGRTNAVSSKIIYRRHARATTTAHRVVSERRILGDRRKIEEAQEQLTQHFENRLKYYVKMNEDMIKTAFEEAKQMYLREMLGGTDSKLQCRSAERLTDAHDRAKDNAIRFFNSKVTQEQNDDTETSMLKKDIKEQYHQMVHFNEINSKYAIADALAKYVDEMERGTGGMPCMTPSRLAAIHKEACQQAEAVNRRKRQDAELPNDKFLIQLRKDMQEKYEKFKDLNSKNNELAMAETISAYKENLSAQFQGRCLSVKDLKKDEARVREKALNIYSSRKTAGDDNANDPTLKRIIEAMDEYHEEMKDYNDDLNKQAIEAALTVYNSSMDAETKGLKGWKWLPVNVISMPFRLGRFIVAIEGCHEKARDKAIQHFKENQRQGSGLCDDDYYFSKLKSEMESRLREYLKPDSLIWNQLGLSDN